ncbi:Na(+)/H(+) antiporter subunit C [Streptomyces harbinensis]|uniref:Multicomponent Na+:H+ antiporter subunit C n=1 Tax=Streptomyces harbinensis TaxID=1176198 RepID=A0A1I6R0H7_9ACTN|nr:Na(+)/H(+) antiporter subunit C [Streptomyces harbinensis]SFS58172.1 multicomponent Na+:H+ antiporter subunit C [Streptomyces harbinensis]
MTTLDLAMATVVGGLFATGFFLLLDRSLMRILLGVIVLGHAANLLLILSGGAPASPPVTGSEGPDGRLADPLPQAMALTAIVITFGITTLLLAMVHRAWQLDGHDEVRDDVEDRRIGTVHDRAEERAAAESDLPADRGERR